MALTGLRNRARRLLWERGFRSCVYCARALRFDGDKVDLLTVDHVIPKTKGGPDRWDNWAAACPTCNTAKGAMDLPDFLALIARHGPPLPMCDWGGRRRSVQSQADKANARAQREIDRKARAALQGQTAKGESHVGSVSERR